jgi:redox-sensitive bicupin YhaK (pirin superfamily)
VVNGALAHKDSMGNMELIKRGDVQMTSAGTGISHSEFNDSETDPVHFIQIWIEPSKKGLMPAYYTKHFSDEEKKNKLRLIVAPNVSAHLSNSMLSTCFLRVCRAKRRSK